MKYIICHPERQRRIPFFSVGIPQLCLGMTAGITIVELLLSITIIGMFSTLAIINFRSSKQDDLLRIAAFRAADAVRASQSYALAGVPQNTDPAIAQALIFGASIKKITDDVGEIILFADKTGGQQGKYDANDKDIRTISLDPDGRKIVVLKKIEIDGSDTVAPVDIAFKKPDAAGFINGDTTAKEIVLTFEHTQSRHTRTVTINRVTGRVDAQF